MHRGPPRPVCVTIIPPSPFTPPPPPPRARARRRRLAHRDEGHVELPLEGARARLHAPGPKRNPVRLGAAVGLGLAPIAIAIAKGAEVSGGPPCHASDGYGECGVNSRGSRSPSRSRCSRSRSRSRSRSLCSLSLSRSRSRCSQWSLGATGGPGCLSAFMGAPYIDDRSGYKLFLVPADARGAWAAARTGTHLPPAGDILDSHSHDYR
ncbi:hypothetical protein B0H16DRAFT_1885048 [Mycena metata]|uniref:Uncharacterized protein n=1 Tax=Mycena metata TaxID=1033252 RepID=A0AAD7J803_9AGAR|nr:hypothetical protein B0H16DRAFT_1885048 [Mycena metata]